MIDLIAEGERLSKLIDTALAEYSEHALASADADHAYSQARATAYVKITEGTVAQREAQVDIETGAEHLEYVTARATDKITREVLQSRRQQLSAIQSLLKHPEISLEVAVMGQGDG